MSASQQSEQRVAPQLPAGREVLIEFQRLDDFVRVCAVDAATGLEAVTVGPAQAALSDLERLATRKLARLLVRAGVIAHPSRTPKTAARRPRGRLV